MNDDKLLQTLAQDLSDLCHRQFIQILSHENRAVYHPLHLSLIEYIHCNSVLSSRIVNEPLKFLPLLDEAALIAQQTIFREQCPNNESIDHGVDQTGQSCSLKKIHVRIIHPNDCKELKRTKVPLTGDLGKFVFFRGTVIRTGMIKMVQTEQTYICQKCQKEIPCRYSLELYNEISKPDKCLQGESEDPCNSKKFNLSTKSNDKCKDYQEIKVQELVTKLEIGNIPTSITVILLDDLVDTVNPGDNVQISGYVFSRWKPSKVGDRCKQTICLFANCVESTNMVFDTIPSKELIAEFEDFWRIPGSVIQKRDMIVESFCPNVYGMYIVKLALLMVLVGGTAVEDKTRIRGDSHMLLVGDPGTAKSQFLRYVSLIAPRTIYTTGVGSTNAGLTVAAVKDGGEWSLEAGALVLADKGVCCIDEFSSIREHDKTAIHEAMEQQSISVAKAGLVCKLNTRCSIIAATNPKGKYDTSVGIDVNIALGSPLISRFDLIMILIDSPNPDWDREVSDFILRQQQKTTTKPTFDLKKMQAYLTIVKKRDPILTDGCNKVLTSYYQKQRSSDNRNASRTTIRLLESLIRLAQAHAKLTFQPVVGVRDAVVAIMLFERSMMTCMGTTSVLHEGFPSNHSDFVTEGCLLLGSLRCGELTNELSDELNLENVEFNTPSVAQDRWKSINLNFEIEESRDETRLTQLGAKLSDRLSSQGSAVSWAPTYPEVNSNSNNGEDLGEFLPPVDDISGSLLSNPDPVSAEDSGQKFQTNSKQDSIPQSVNSIKSEAVPFSNLSKPEAALKSFFDDSDADPFGSDDEIGIGNLGEGTPKSQNPTSQSSDRFGLGQFRFTKKR